MQSIEAKNPDIILVASQSQTIANNWGTLGQLPLSQRDFLLGTRPNAFILCVIFWWDSLHKKNNSFSRNNHKRNSYCYGWIIYEDYIGICEDITEPEVVNDFAAMKIKLEQEISYKWRVMLTIGE